MFSVLGKSLIVHRLTDLLLATLVVTSSWRISSTPCCFGCFRHFSAVITFRLFNSQWFGSGKLAADSASQVMHSPLSLGQIDWYSRQLSFDWVHPITYVLGRHLRPQLGFYAYGCRPFLHPPFTISAPHPRAFGPDFAFSQSR